MGSEGPAVVTDLKLSKVGETDIIVPAEPTPNGRVFLSNIDQCLVIPVETVYFYPPNPNKPLDNLVETLKSALAKVLVPYHFMTGRLRPEAVPGSRRLEIDLNRAGAEFAQFTSDVRIADLGDVVQPNPLFRALVPTKFQNVSSALDTPLLAVQLTIFRCGGYTMGFMMSHTIFDGPGAIDFFLNWTSIARGEGLLFTPTFDRTCLKARDPPIVKYEHPENFELPADVGLEAGVSPFSLPDEQDKEFEELENISTHITKTFPFTPEIIDTLKKKALEGGVIKRVSTFEVVAAHIWLARTKSVELPEVPFNLLFAVDIRSRMVPPLPKHFAGNAVYSACARGTPSQIKKHTFVEAVQVVQAAITRVTDDYVRSSFDWGETRRGIPALFGGFFLSAWWKMPFYSIDYGWGKPIYAGPIVTPLVEFVLLLANGKQDGGLNLVMALEPEQMELFEEHIKVE